MKSLQTNSIDMIYRFVIMYSPYSRGTEFTYLAKNATLALERYTADFFVCIECQNIA